MTETAQTRPQFYFTDGDAELLELLVAYRYLQPGDFQKLTNRNIVSLRRRLRELVGREYLERLTLPLERDTLNGNPPDGYVYQLAARGIRKAKEYGFADGYLRHTREKSNLFLAHDMLITRFHMSLALATRGASLVLTGWEQRRAVLLDSAGNGYARLSVNPDALFGLTDREKPEGQNAAYFFLEIVRSRESEYEREQSNFMRKMEAYAAYHRQGKAAARFGIANFRVITVTPTKQRALNLCAKLKEASLASARFWFTDLASASERILDKIFFTPKDADEGTVYGFRD